MILDKAKRAQGVEGYHEQFIDVREDRVLSYGRAPTSMGKIRYSLRATNLGSFKVPAPQMESMYYPDRRGNGNEDMISVIKK